MLRLTTQAVRSGCARLRRAYEAGYEKVIVIPDGSLRAPETKLSDLRAACGPLNLPNCRSERYRRLNYAELAASILSSPLRRRCLRSKLPCLSLAEIGQGGRLTKAPGKDIWWGESESQNGMGTPDYARNVARHRSLRHLCLHVYSCVRGGSGPRCARLWLFEIPTNSTRDGDEIQRWGETHFASHFATKIACGRTPAPSKATFAASTRGVGAPLRWKKWGDEKSTVKSMNCISGQQRAVECGPVQKFVESRMVPIPQVQWERLKWKGEAKVIMGEAKVQGPKCQLGTSPRRFQEPVLGMRRSAKPSARISWVRR